MSPRVGAGVSSSFSYSSVAGASGGPARLLRWRPVPIRKSTQLQRRSEKKLATEAVVENEDGARRL